MKKLAGIACAAVLGLSLVACGGNAEPKAEDTTSQTTQTDTQAVEAPSIKDYEGEWKLAAIEHSGFTVTGNYADIYGDEKGNVLTINADGTGTSVAGNSTTNLTWKDNGSGSLIITDEAETEQDLATLVDNMLMVSTGELANAFTRDGTYPKLPKIDFKGTAIDSADKLLGTWKIFAARNTDYGDYLIFGQSPEAIAAYQQFSTGDLVFEDGGRGTMLGYDMTWSLNESGVTIVITETGGDLTVSETDEGIVCKSNIDGASYAFKK